MIQASFTDLVGTSALPAHAYDIEELTELTPALDTATATHDMANKINTAAGAMRFMMASQGQCN
jgi:hypothetical protein